MSWGRSGSLEDDGGKLQLCSRSQTRGLILELEKIASTSLAGQGRGTNCSLQQEETRDCSSPLEQLYKYLMYVNVASAPVSVPLPWGKTWG